jgi:hypothetical protein
MRVFVDLAQLCAFAALRCALHSETGTSMDCARFQQAGSYPLQFRNQIVHPFQKVFFAGVRVFSKYRHGMLGHTQFARLACPAAHIAISQERKASQFIAATCVLQVGQKIVKAQLEA